MLSFKFRGLDSYNDFGIIITKRPPIILPQRNVAYEKIPGRSGLLTYDERTYNDVSIPIECAFESKEFIERADEIKAWLSGYPDKLSFSDEDDKYYEAQVVNKIDIVQSVRVLGEFVIMFNCKPFKKAVNDFDIFKTCELNTTRNSIVINPLQSYNYVSGEVIGANKTIEINKTKEFLIVNTGTVESSPKIKLIGTGDITLTINGRSFSILGLTDYIVVDSELIDAYRDTELMNNKMVGEFPILDVGENLISYDGNLTAIEIMPNTQFI